MDTAEERAERRRATWTGGKARMGEEMDAADAAFWARATPSERLDAVFQMAVDACVMEGRDETPAGLRGSVGGIRRRGG